jgi:hypothetical protein
MDDFEALARLLDAEKNFCRLWRRTSRKKSRKIFMSIEA